MSKYYYEKSGILESSVNITYHELFTKTDEELDVWIGEVRDYIIEDWDERGTPPMVGQSIEQIISSFKKLREYDIHGFIEKADDGQRNVIKNFNKFANGVNQFFPTMLKTRIGDMGDVTLNSIYDRIKEDVNKDLFYKAMRRGIRRDSMYSFSKSISLDRKENEKNKIISFVKLVKNVSIQFLSSKGIPKGWVTKMWNRAFKKAYDDGCDYFYQCGDDIEFLDKEWVIDCIKAMKKNKNTGITGPIDWGREQHKMLTGNGKFILTQTFVSRKHMNNFGFYFPEEIKNWFCDDWITYIYISKKKYWPIKKRIFNKGGDPRYKPEGKGYEFKPMAEKCMKLIHKYNKCI